MHKGDLDKQDIFRQYNNTTWYDDIFDFQLTFDGNGCNLSSYCEADGKADFLTNIKTLKELKDMYELLTGKDFIIKND